MGLKYHHILVAVDGSKEAEWAFKKGIEMAKRNHASLLLVHVIDLRSFAMVETYDKNMMNKADQLATEMLEKYKSLALEEGVEQVSYEIDYGNPKLSIPKILAIKHNIDLIICGATGRNAVERFFIGSVSEHITRYAKCDVLIVRTEKDS